MPIIEIPEAEPGKPIAVRLDLETEHLTDALRDVRWNLRGIEDALMSVAREIRQLRELERDLATKSHWSILRRLQMHWLAWQWSRKQRREAVAMREHVQTLIKNGASRTGKFRSRY